VNWVNNKIGTNRKVKTAPSAVTVLGADNFDKFINKDNQKSVLVKFYAPWCGHCKTLAPKYEELAKIFAGEKSVVIAKVDATEERSLGEKFDVQGFPSMKWFPAGSDTPVDYEGGREVEDMVKFINDNAGTKRSTDGGLLEDAGRVKALDDIITAAAGAGKNVDDSLVASLKAASALLTGTDLAASKVYISVAEKIAAKGSSYPETESKRLLGMISNPSVKPDQKTNFMLKYNIIAAFK
jgi:protein disulfide-isomerase A6